MINGKALSRIFVIFLLGLLIGGSWAGADVFTQCPADTDGIDTDGDGIADNDHICIHLAAGDGCGLYVDHNGIGGDIDYTGIAFAYEIVVP